MWLLISVAEVDYAVVFENIQAMFLTVAPWIFEDETLISEIKELQIFYTTWNMFL